MRAREIMERAAAVLGRSVDLSNCELRLCDVLLLERKELWTTASRVQLALGRGADLVGDDRDHRDGEEGLRVEHAQEEEPHAKCEV